jgi:hypothetical protein
VLKKLSNLVHRSFSEQLLFRTQIAYRLLLFRREPSREIRVEFESPRQPRGGGWLDLRRALP